MRYIFFLIGCTLLQGYIGVLDVSVPFRAAVNISAAPPDAVDSDIVDIDPTMTDTTRTTSSTSAATPPTPAPAATTTIPSQFFSLLRPVGRGTVFRSTFTSGLAGWQPSDNCQLRATGGLLRAASVRGNPVFYRNVHIPCNQSQLRMKIRTETPGNLKIQWLTAESPRRSDEKSVMVSLVADGQWRQYDTTIPVNGTLLTLILEGMATNGAWEFESIEMEDSSPSPLVIQNIVEKTQNSTGNNSLENPSSGQTEQTGQTGKVLEITIKNDSTHEVSLEGSILAPGTTMVVTVPVHLAGNLECSRFQLSPDNSAPTAYSFFRYVPDSRVPPPLQNKWRSFSLPEAAATLEIAENGQMARLVRDGVLAAIIAPLVHRGGVIPKFEMVSTSDNKVSFDSPEVTMTLTVTENGVLFNVEEKEKEKNENGDEGEEYTPPTDIQPLEGPVVRAIGTLRGGLLCGVEYLGEGDTSSSTISVTEPWSRRYLPPREWVTIPLAAFATDRGTVAMSWDDMELQPTFASPNFVDITDGHRMSLLGTSPHHGITATVTFFAPFSRGTPREDDSAPSTAAKYNPLLDTLQDIPLAILWYVQTKGFPPPPSAPRTVAEQQKLVLNVLNGPLSGDDGRSWGYGVESQWPRESYGDVLAAIWQLTASPPRVANVVYGGTALPNDTIYFVTDRVEMWLDSKAKEIENIMASQQPDGSMACPTRFPSVEKAETSVGFTAHHAAVVLAYIHYTNDTKLFNRIEPTLKWLQTQTVPRGGHYWETPNHTPSLLAAAYLTRTFTLAFQWSQNPDYLAEARRWALTGLPFVYLWQQNDKPTMKYCTIPMMGASQRISPVWFGQSQPWTGIVFADSLNELAKYDTMVDWKTVAVGITTAAEQMLYSEGSEAGCLPEVFSIATQQRSSWKLNPAALTLLRQAVDGNPVALSVVHDSKDWYTSPYPIRLTPRGLEADSVPSGQKFQILRNGNVILHAEGSGGVTSVRP